MLRFFEIQTVSNPLSHLTANKLTPLEMASAHAPGAANRPDRALQLQVSAIKVYKEAQVANFL
jgi:hypothetical protein